MPHQDLKAVAQGIKGDCLSRSLQQLLGEVDWAQIRFRDDCTWTPPRLSAVALLWVWSDELTLGERFRTARKIIMFLFAWQQQLAGSYQAFLKMLVRWTANLVLAIQLSLRLRMPQHLPAVWEVYGFIMFGVDGSRADTPRTRSNEEAFSPTRSASKSSRKKSNRSRPRKSAHEKKSNSPQMWLTTMWHVGTGLPWDWRIGPSDSSERAHLLEMLPHLPAGALITADAGFVGYEYARTILDSGRNLLIRVGANVRLLRKLGYARERGNTVYLWPDKAASKNCPPLVLRLVVAHNGKHPVYLITSVLATSRLSDAQVVELYGRRWGIELFYRHLKQTFQRRKLRSTTAEHARVELEWSLVGLWAMGFYALLEADRVGTPPSKLSIAHVLRAFRRTMRDYRHPAERGETLRHHLREAIIDSYIRHNKASRDYPRKKQEKAPGLPDISTATPQQVAHAKQLAITIKKG